MGRVLAHALRPAPNGHDPNALLVVGLVYATFVISHDPGCPAARRLQPVPGRLPQQHRLRAERCRLLRPGPERPVYQRSWRWFGVGLALYGAGNIYWTIFIRIQDPEPFPVLADALWLSFYPCAFIALLLIVREICRGRPAEPLAGRRVGGLAVAGVAAGLLRPDPRSDRRQQARGRDHTRLPAARRTAAAGGHGVGRALQLAAAVSLWLLFGGLALFSVADAVYLFSASNGTYQVGGLGDAVWVAATLLIGFAPAKSAQATGSCCPTGCGSASRSVPPSCALVVLVYDHEHLLNVLAVTLLRRNSGDRPRPADRDLPGGQLAGR
jgi:hypothetical protein